MDTHEALLIMGLAPNFSPDELKQQFRVLVKKYHPDTGHSPEKFMSVMAAYRLLLRVQEAGYDFYSAYQPEQTNLDDAWATVVLLGGVITLCAAAIGLTCALTLLPLYDFQIKTAALFGAGSSFITKMWAVITPPEPPIF